MPPLFLTGQNLGKCRQMGILSGNPFIYVPFLA
jgi:hypothetical protein